MWRFSVIGSGSSRGLWLIARVSRVGRVDSVELVTVGQRKGLGLAGGTDPHYVIDVDPLSSTVTVGTAEDLLVEVTPLESWVWAGEAFSGEVECSARLMVAPELGSVVDGFVRWRNEHRRIAPGQSVVAYRDDRVVGGGTAGREADVPV